MALVLSQIIENVLQVDGNRYISYQYVFNNGNTIRFNSMQKPGDYDVDAGLIEYAAIAEIRIIEKIDSGLMTQVENGELAPLDAEPYHPSTETIGARKKRFRRKLLGWIANEPDLKIIRKVFYPIWCWLRFESSYTAQQIADYLGISLTVLQRINNRFQALHDSLSFIDGDEQYIGEID